MSEKECNAVLESGPASARKMLKKRELKDASKQIRAVGMRKAILERRM
jgi:hypothetical protein